MAAAGLAECPRNQPIVPTAAAAPASRHLELPGPSSFQDPTAFAANHAKRGERCRRVMVQPGRCLFAPPGLQPAFAGSARPRHLREALEAATQRDPWHFTVAVNLHGRVQPALIIQCAGAQHYHTLHEVSGVGDR
jgi:hypothetical protein